MPRRAATLILLATLSSSAALAHHRQTPPVVAITTTGETDLPRLPAPGRTTLVLAQPTPGGTSVYTVMPYAVPMTGPPITLAGDNRNPTVSRSGRVVAYDTDADPFGSGLPGRQIVVARRGTLVAGPADPTGTSRNAVVDGTGNRLAFESTGDLAGTGNPGVQQIFYGYVGGGVWQVSTGYGTSRNPALSRRGWLAYESTTDPVTDDDTSVEQIWLGSVQSLTASRLTTGLAPSTRPSFSDDGTILAFQSRANLAGDGSDMGVPQVFVYDTKSQTSAQLTFDPAGCTNAAVAKAVHDWRVGFVCGGTAYFYMLREDALYRLDTPDGDATGIVPELGIHFVVVATDGNMLGTGTTPGHQVYLVNLYKRPGTAMPAPTAVWFPHRGIKPLL